MTNVSAEVHPRPQMARERWIDLCGPWAFVYDDADNGLLEAWYERGDVFDQTIIVPFPPESEASGIGDPRFHPVVWYRRTFEVDPEDRGKRLLLHFGAVDYRAQVWINGRLVLMHEGGQTPFSGDITGALVDDGEQVIVVRAEDLPADLAQPRGKQDWREEPHDIWYERTTGIWQPVWLEPLNDTYITSVRWTPDLDRGRLGMAVTFRRRTPGRLEARVQLRLHDMELTDDAYVVTGADLQREIALDLQSLAMDRDRVLWSPDHPNLVDVTITVYADGAIIDQVTSYAGLRSVNVAEGRFLLNGRPYYLHMVLDQGYWPQSHLAPPSAQALRRDVELAKALGFNGVRIHQKVADPRYLYWCDRLGLLVWGEMANAYVFSPIAVQRLTREWMEVLDRDHSHPCIVVWVPLNESWGVPNLPRDAAQQHFVQALYHLTKALDPTRPVVANDGWEHLVGDVLGIHDYTFHGETIVSRYGSLEEIDRTLREVQPQFRFMTLLGRRHGSEPVMVTEFGGISYRPVQGSPWYGYGTVKSQEDYLDKYRELVGAILDCPNVAGFCYTQLTDTRQETNGLLSADRRPKIDPRRVREITEGLPRAVPGEIIEHLQRVRGTAFGGASAQTEPAGITPAQDEPWTDE